MKPLILISNDDGINAKGLHALVVMLSPLGNLFVVAPDRARSGASCSITSEYPIKQTLVKSEDGLTMYSCTGTPADCVKLALDQMLGRQPDLIVGGINHGNNATINIHYSGTVGIAIEGTLHGIPSIAYSLDNQSADADFAPLTSYIRRLTSLVLEKGLPFGSCLNVNFPSAQAFAGTRICRMAYSSWIDEYTLCNHPHGEHYYWLGGECINDEPDESDTDSWALERDFIAITPIKVDATDFELKDMLGNWDL